MKVQKMFIKTRSMKVIYYSRNQMYAHFPLADEMSMLTNPSTPQYRATNLLQV